MFRKILIAFVLLASLAGLSYLKTAREHTKQDALYEKAKTDITTDQKSEAGKFENKIDSLGKMLVVNQESYSNSITTQKSSYETQLDSLENIIDNQSAKITKLNKQTTQSKQTVSKKRTKPRQLSKHEKIYRYYKQRYVSLPGDLSTYEQKIALSEIREETASKFSISLSELSKIRKEYKLNY